jgi:hypothetical protein
MRERHRKNKYFGQEYGKKQRRDEKSDCRGNGGGTKSNLNPFKFREWN